jgi:hypothetical protein
MDGSTGINEFYITTAGMSRKFAAATWADTAERAAEAGSAGENCGL